MNEDRTTLPPRRVLHVNTYPTAKALPIHAGIDRRIFAKHGLSIELHHTENSARQREGLAVGEYEIMHLAVDNAVAMVDAAGHDVVVVMGGDSGMNEFFVQPDVESFSDLRGRALVVDAPDTAYALQARKILAMHGLTAGRDYIVKPVGRGALRLEAMAASKENAAAVLNLPYSLQAEQMGLISLGRTTDFIGPYQAGGVFCLRAWARANGAALESYIAAYVETLRWVRMESSKDACIAMLMSYLNLPMALAERSYVLLVDPSFGLVPDARLDMEGFRNTLALRSEVEAGGRPRSELERYIDLQYYDRAIGPLGSRDARPLTPAAPGNSEPR